VRSSEIPINNTAVRIRILLADDQPAMLAQVARVLGETYDIVGNVGDGLHLLEFAARLDPDVIVLDITMPGIDGFGAARSLKRAGCRSRLVFLTVHEDPDFAREALSLGADAYVVKSRLALDLPSAIKEAVAGRKYISPTVNVRGIAAVSGNDH
jgi:DNA-binding NarL/FixJ family response regulator